MYLKRLLMVLTACCIASGSIAAQSTHLRPQSRANKAMWAALQLTDAQKAHVATIHDKYASALKLAQQQTPDSARVIYTREMADVRELLTLTQQETFDSYMRGSRRGKRGGVAKVMPVRIGVPR